VITKLVALGPDAVLARVIDHDWNLAKSADSLEVHKNTLARFLARYTPTEIARARAQGHIHKGRSPGRTPVLLDASAVRRALRASDGRRDLAAERLGVSCTTLQRTMERLGVRS
jgi:transcriptional regulator with PAS, ATPase and Fis domain